MMKKLIVATGILLLIIAISAFVPSIMVFLDPSGSNLDVSVHILNDSPFESFIIPGIFLFTINGLGSLVASILCFKRHFTAGRAVYVLGILMVIWIIAQVYWIGWLIWLQPLFLGIGIMEIILGVFINKKLSHIN